MTHTAAMESAISLRGLVKRYGERVVVDHLDLDVARGTTVGLLGPNGAGKTTTLEMIQGLTAPTAGSIRVFELEQPRDRDAIVARIGVALQETNLPDKLSTRETLELFRSFYTRGPDEEALLAEVDLQAHANTLVRALSGGERQRLALACALAGDPDLIILDEPTTGLDPEARHRLWDRIEGLARKGRTILITTHFMDEAERLCDRIVVIDRGKAIAQGTPSELIAAHVGTHVVELEVTSGELSLDAARALEHVRVARMVGRTLRLGSDAPDDALAAARALAASSSATLGRVAIGRATLEDVFLVIAGRRLSDET
jgi:ABC-2 type transport system ATP-binding protein